MNPTNNTTDPVNVTMADLLAKSITEKFNATCGENLSTPEKTEHSYVLSQTGDCGSLPACYSLILKARLQVERFGPEPQDILDKCVIELINTYPGQRNETAICDNSRSSIRDLLKIMIGNLQRRTMPVKNQVYIDMQHILDQNASSVACIVTASLLDNHMCNYSGDRMVADHRAIYCLLANDIAKMMMATDESRFTLYDYLDAVINNPTEDPNELATSIINDTIGQENGSVMNRLIELAETKRRTYNLN